MKRKWSLFWLFLTAALLLAGCGSQKEEKGYTVYYIDSTGTKLTELSYNPAAETFDEMMEELLGQLANAPTGSISALPKEVSVLGYERGIDALRIDFSKEYYDLDNIEEVLLRAAVIKTISQIPGVTKIMITVEGAQLTDQDGDLVPAMDAASFIDTKEGGINSYHYATLTFYFADKTGEKLLPETREIHYSSNMVLERVVLEQLLKGPEDTSLKAVVSGSSKILSINVKNDICTINLDAEFNKAPSESSVNPETAIYAIVNSICGACENIAGVKFEINGESDILFRDQVDLAQTFAPQMNLVETESQNAEKTKTEEMKTEGTEKESEAGETKTEPVSEAEAVSEQSADPSAADISTEQDAVSGNTVVGVDPLLAKE